MYLTMAVLVACQKPTLSYRALSNDYYDPKEHKGEVIAFRFLKPVKLLHVGSDLNVSYS
jgi:hypothetical protein